MDEDDPLTQLARWIGDAEAAGLPEPASMALATAGTDRRPSLRTVSLKRLEGGALIFTSALWTRKAREIAANPCVALLFQWPSLGRQVHVAGRAEAGERALAEELFAERPRPHQLQALVSRQGEEIDALAPLRRDLSHIDAELGAAAPECPPDWGAVRVIPDAVEFWEESEDRLHDRLLHSRMGSGWRVTRLAP